MVIELNPLVSSAVYQGQVVLQVWSSVGVPLYSTVSTVFHCTRGDITASMSGLGLNLDEIELY
jgi:hypothetical protein